MLSQLDINQVEKFLFFMGYPRSGHSIVASCLDAHPDIVVGHEFNLFPKLLRSDMYDQLMNKSILFNSLYQNSIRMAKLGWRSVEPKYKKKGYTLHINSSNSWQGRFRRLRIIGDKSGGMTTRCFRDEPELSAKVYIHLLATVQVPVKVLHVVRNPYDMIATRLLYRHSSGKGKKANYSKQNPLMDSHSLSQALNNLKTEAETVSNFGKRWASVMLEVHNTDFIHDTQGTLRNICKFLGVECSASYLKLCYDTTFNEPTQSRHAVFWSENHRIDMDMVIKKYPFFHRYSFDSL